MLLAFAVVAGLTVFVTPSAAQAVDIANAIKTVTITEQDGTTPTNGFQRTDTVRVDATWSVPDGTKSGSTFSMTLPSTLRPLTATFSLVTPDGQSAGSCSASAQFVQCTLSSYVDGKTNVRGTLFFGGQLNFAQTDSGSQTISISTGAVSPILVTVTFGPPPTGGSGGGTTPDDFAKSCIPDTVDSEKVVCAIDLPDRVALSDVTIVDRVSTGNATLDKSSLFIGSRTLPSGSFTTVTPQPSYTVSNNQDGSDGFTITFPNGQLDTTKNQYNINYTMSFTPGNNSTKNFANTATLSATSQPKYTGPSDVSSSSFFAGGTGQGNNGLTISTQASPQTGSTTGNGTTVQDTISLSPTPTADTFVDWRLLGPVTAGAGQTCDQLDYSSADVVTSGQVRVQGGSASGVVPQPGKALTAAGCYVFREKLADSSGGNGTWSPTNDANETVLITKPPVPTVTTKASSSPLGNGQSLSDGITLTNSGGQPTTVDWQLIGPVTPSATGTCDQSLDWSNAANQVSGTATFSSDGHQTVPPPGQAIVVGRPGCYTFQAKVDGGTADYPVPGSEPTEVVLVPITKIAPAVSTKASLQSASVEATLTDDLTLTGDSTAVPVTVDWQLVGPVKPNPTNNSCDSGADWTNLPAVIPYKGTATFGQNGTVTVPGNGQTKAAVNAVGCYTFQAKVDQDDANGITGTNFTTAGSEPSEIVQVTPVLSVSTQASPQVLPVGGGSVHDTVTLSALQATATQVDWQLVGPVTAGSGQSCDQLDYSHAATVVGGTVTVPANTSSIDTADVSVSGAGCYVFQERLSAAPGAQTASWSPTSDTREVVLVPPTPVITPVTPDVSTKVTRDVLHQGEFVADQIILKAAATVPVTVDWRLIGPVTESASGDCGAGAAWATAATDVPAAHSGNVTLPAGATSALVPDANGLALTALGCYVFQQRAESATGVTGTEYPTQVGPIANETVRVIPPVTTKSHPSIGTTISAQTVKAGSPIHDEITVSDAAGATLTVSWQLLGPVQPVTAGTCEGVDWAALTPITSGTVMVSDSGSVVTPDFVVSLPGCYTYVESAAETATTQSVQTTPGLTPETVLVTPMTGPNGGSGQTPPVSSTPTGTPATPLTVTASAPAALAYTGAGNLELMAIVGGLVTLAGLMLLLGQRRQTLRQR
ncbi:MAG: hypothetical protein JO147_00675 [Actinobacteria bacterium]|nr:hypothetical protein [Actinomycetota bacterium]